jgi:hypothetical protein
MAKKRKAKAKARKFELGFVQINEKGKSGRKVSGKVTRIRKTRKWAKRKTTRKSTKAKSKSKSTSKRKRR